MSHELQPRYCSICSFVHPKNWTCPVAVTESIPENINPDPDATVIKGLKEEIEVWKKRHDEEHASARKCRLERDEYRSKYFKYKNAFEALLDVIKSGGLS